jgi:hypothetical protein
MVCLMAEVLVVTECWGGMAPERGMIMRGECLARRKQRSKNKDRYDWEDSKKSQATVQELRGDFFYSSGQGRRGA